MAKILVVDDNIDHLETLGAILESAGHSVVKENKAKDVLKIVQRERPDVVMMDIYMPEMNGYEISRLLKSNDATKGVFILMHSSTARIEEVCEKILESGAEDFISMPANKNEIIARLNICLKRNKDLTERKRTEEERKQLNNLLLEKMNEIQKNNQRLQDAYDELRSSEKKYRNLTESLNKEITERKKIEEMILRLNNCFLELETNPAKNIEIIIKTAGEVLGCTCALYNKLDGNVLCTIGKWQAPPDMPLKDKAKGHICYDVINVKRKEPFIIKNLDSSSYAETDPNVKKYRLKTYIGAAINAKDKTIGSLCAVYQENREFKPYEIEAISILARALGKEEERKQTDEVLLESEKKYKLLADNAADVIWITGMDTNLIYISPSVTRMLGFTVEESLGRSMKEAYSPASYNAAMQSLAEEMAVENKGNGDPNRTRILELELYHKNGNTVLVEANFKFLRDSAGKPTGMLCIARDISERKKIEKELVNSERMAGIGQLAAGIAHEFNNLLNIIGGSAEYARGVKDEREIKESLDTIIKSSDRGADIVRGLLRFAGRETTKKQLVDITTVLEETADLVKRDLEISSIEIVKEYSSVPKTVINIGQIKQVFLNIILNAQKAMPKGGVLTIKLERSKNFLAITFHNTGREIPVEDISRLFTPFLRLRTSTGKESYGLGLSISYGIIQSHGGTIETVSERRKGTAFIIKLPIAKKGVTQRVEKIKDIIASAQKKIKVKKGKHYAILVVDDEENTCKLFKKILEKESYMVNTAGDGKTAVKLCENKHFDLIYLDLVMPKMDGIAVFKKICKIDPDAEIVLITGKLIEDKVAGMYIDKGAAGFIRKPIHIKEFVKNTKLFLSGSQR